MSDDPYEGFAERYDLFSETFDTHDPAIERFYRRLFAEHGVHRVLDCACGTGRDLALFHELGCAVVGSDVSEAMLAQARINLASAGLSIPLRQIDFRELPGHFDHPFDAVACLSSSILHMEDECEVLHAFLSIREVLRDGGILVLTQGTTDRQWREKPRFIPAVMNRDFTRLFVIDYIGAGARYNVLDIVHGETSREFKAWSIDYPMMLLRDDYVRLLNEAQFSTVDCYGSYAFSPYDPEQSRLLIVVAER
ncbi:MAG: class I SAM-dependent methyltransferase [Candidatus Eisenbacteria bacterium]|jgi:SAM-dependent methyltransferase|nr:class I SAM-dependent methyltransferase [Candidatus Eisenbacteria bacterium]